MTGYLPAKFAFLDVYQLGTIYPYAIAKITTSRDSAVTVIFGAMTSQEFDCIEMGTKYYLQPTDKCRIAMKPKNEDI